MPWSRLIILVVLTLISVVVALGQGQVSITYQEIASSLFSSNEQLANALHSKIVLELRLPRVLIAFICGAGLAITGVILQTLTRNPLADPYLFGISSGASFGAVLALSLGSSGLGLSLGAMAGSTLSIALMLLLAGRSVTRINHLILAGVAVSFLLGSLTSLVLYYSDPNVVSALLFWLMGSFEHIGMSDIFWPSLALGLTFGVAFLLHRQLDAILAGDQLALSLGVSPPKLRIGLFLIAAGLTAILVSRVGGIGFVGLMIPHMARFINGHQLRYLLPTALLVGGLFMIWVDVLARSILQSQQMPLGVITAAFGSVFFIILLHKQQRNQLQEF